MPQRAAARNTPAGVHDLFVIQTGATPIEVDWISFRSAP